MGWCDAAANLHFEQFNDQQAAQILFNILAIQIALIHSILLFALLYFHLCIFWHSFLTLLDFAASSLQFFASFVVVAFLLQTIEQNASNQLPSLSNSNKTLTISLAQQKNTFILTDIFLCTFQENFSHCATDTLTHWHTHISNRLKSVSM